jgi:osmoprotectant transport system permease protein
MPLRNTINACLSGFSYMCRTGVSLCLVLLNFSMAAAAPGTVNVGSKRFTEAYILGEIVTQVMQAEGEARVTHRQGLGNTAILFTALKSGAIDIYPEYTGTIALELLGLQQVPDLDELNRSLARHGLAAAIALGFSNSYALAMREEQAAAIGISSISELKRHRGLRLGLSQEFLNRKDGWPALSRAYGLSHANPRGLDHGLAYEALAAGEVDVIDIYSTDAKIAHYRLRVLADDIRFFPAYDAVLVYRLDLPVRFPRSWQALQHLKEQISPTQMIAMNGAAELSGVSFQKVAGVYLSGPGAVSAVMGKGDNGHFVDLLFGADFWRLTWQHSLLVFASLALSIIVGVPLGIWAARMPRAGFWIVGTTGVLQTVPALALLAFLIAALDRIGTLPAILALFLYALLPIVRNTQTGLAGISPSLKQSATALGLRDRPRLRLIELPLALPSILAGIRTSAVINVGTATIAAFIGAGGYGERIVAGLAVNDHRLLLAGAIPAAALALVLEWGFIGLDRAVVPKGIRQPPAAHRP